MDFRCGDDKARREYEETHAGRAGEHRWNGAPVTGEQQTDAWGTAYDTLKSLVAENSRSE